jgi:hypothetical protein
MENKATLLPCSWERKKSSIVAGWLRGKTKLHCYRVFQRETKAALLLYSSEEKQRRAVTV